MKKYQQLGFTLIELLITVAIAGVVMAIAIPNMGQFIKNERLTSFSNTLIADLMFARSEAVKQNQQVVLCASNDGASCTNTNLEEGWIAFRDINNNGSPADVSQIIKIQQSITGDIQYVDGGLNSITFDSRGFAPNTNGAISVCDDRGDDYAKSLAISVTGRVSRGGNPACP